MKIVDFSDLLGKTLSSVDVNERGNEIYFKTSDGDEYKMYHQQDCCERVSIEDINGEIKDLVGTPLIQAEENSSSEGDRYHGGEAWTFYKLATNRGHVVIRWHGSSNGYYSESVDFLKI